MWRYHTQKRAIIGTSVNVGSYSTATFNDIAFQGEFALVATDAGVLLKIQLKPSLHVMCIFELHASPITCLACSSNVIVCSSGDKVQVWAKDFSSMIMEVQNETNVAEVCLSADSLHVCILAGNLGILNIKTNKYQVNLILILATTKFADIDQISRQKNFGCCHGLDLQRILHRLVQNVLTLIELCAVAEDAKLRIFDFEGQQIYEFQLKTPTCVAYYPHEYKLACGEGETVRCIGTVHKMISLIFLKILNN